MKKTDAFNIILKFSKFHLKGVIVPFLMVRCTILMPIAFNGNLSYLASKNFTGSLSKQQKVYCTMWNWLAMSILIWKMVLRRQLWQPPSRRRFNFLPRSTRRDLGPQKTFLQFCSANPDLSAAKKRWMSWNPSICLFFFSLLVACTWF